MVFLHIDKTNFKKNGNKLISDLERYMSEKKNQIFMLIFMEGCGPCIATRPEWNKIKNILSSDFLNRKDIIIASVDHTFADNLKHLTSKPAGFPTMRYITNAGKNVENYEDSEISNKDRTIDSFVEWIKLKTGENNITKSEQDRSQSGGKKCRKTRRKSHRKSCKKSRRKTNRKR
jgi:hypothetical protein